MKKLFSLLFAALMFAAVGCSDDATNEPTPTPPAGGNEVTLSAEIVYFDHEKVSFRFTATNAETVHYLVMPGNMAAMDAGYVVTNGQSVSASSKEQVTVEGLEVKTAYQLLVVAVGANQQTKMADPMPFTTEDDPSKVIQHTYTRAKGFVLGSGSFGLDLSYEDANEADNFAYDENFLGLYGSIEPGNEYLPAGEYSFEDGTLVSRFSEYGYESAVRPETGTLTVEILDGAENKYYRFAVDLVLQNGRRVIATYEGEVDGMPIKNTIYVTTDYTTAQAEKKSEDGSKWQLKLKDADGNEAVLDLYNAFPLDYLATSIYTNSTSAEATDTEFGPSEFDGTTSAFKVANGVAAGTYKYKTGSLTLDVLWESQQYMLSFYATLENDVVVESEYTGAIEGISLAPSTAVEEVAFTTARATSVGNGATWNVTLLNEAGYDVRFTAECGASPEGLPEGEYTAGTGVGHVSLDMAKIAVPGETTYDFQTLLLNVTTDKEAKTYKFVLEGKIADGRTYKCTFEGKVEGMEVVEKEEIGDLSWTTVTDRRWTSSNRELRIVDSTGAYTIELDLKGCADDHIASGIYTSTGTTQCIQLSWSYFNGDKSIKDATLEVDYDETTKEYDLAFTIVLQDGRTLEGTYSGAIGSHVD